jgi:hypothetical protein
VNLSSPSLSRCVCFGVGVAILLTIAAGSASAQADPNPGAVTVTTAVDFPSVYFFRGIRQETDPALTTFAAGDLGIALFTASGGQTVSVNFGVWNSLHTGTSGTGAEPKKPSHYEEDFYAMLNVGVGHGVTISPFYTAYTSPNSSFGTVKELAIKFAHASKFAPYGIVAFELSGQADGGNDEGTYLELGVGPSWTLGGKGATVGIPVKLGVSLSDYYELEGEDNKFGYVDVGVLFTMPFTSAPTKFGLWNVHAGVNFLGLGDTTKAFNAPEGDPNGGQVIVSAGIGMSY